MNNEQNTPYVSPKVEIIALASADVITTSDVFDYVPDNNEDKVW